MQNCLSVIVFYCLAMSVQELEAEITRLSPSDLKKLADWFQTFQGPSWNPKTESTLHDGKIEDSTKAGRPPSLSIKSFNLGAKGSLPSRSEIAEEMFDRQ